MSRFTRCFRLRWKKDGGYRELFVIALPLIASTATWSVQHFVDRMFLAWYLPDAVAAAMPAGLLSFTVSCIFIGTAGYVGTFTAQYFGAGILEKCGPSLWQGLYVALIGGTVQLMFIPPAGFLFAVVGHGPDIRVLERLYFSILCGGGYFIIASSAMAGFLSGLGRTRPVMWVNITATAVNLFLDWLLIFGNWGFPEMGITGAGVATVAALAIGTIIYGFIIAGPRYRKKFATLRGWRYDRPLFRSLVRYGFPSGIQFFIDVAGFTIFSLLMGRLGMEALAATTIAFNISTLAFMPMIGIGIATSVLVARRLGENRPDLASDSTWSAFHVTFGYMALLSLLYVTLPDLFIMPFARTSDTATFAAIEQYTIFLLRFVAVYSLFDTMNIIFSSALKGAGDTRYIMIVTFVLSLLLLVVPAWTAAVLFSGGLYLLWTIASIYIMSTGCIFLYRFLGGAWKSMRVIEEVPIVVPPAAPETPLSDPTFANTPRRHA
ncbi:MAG TPA: MATE family efflux transporter [Deltaproteobacteria bacterium]|nr:MATE family efflux transporter [Deltaproteobacteria bacterium]